MKLYYISHWRFPSEKTMSPLIMRTCEEFVDQGTPTVLVIPDRKTSSFNENPYKYHNVKENFVIKRIWVLDLIESIGGNLSFLLMVASFNVSLFFFALKRNDGVYYVHDARDAFLLSFLNRKYVLEIHDFYESRLGFLTNRVFRRAYKFVVTNQYKIEQITKKFNLSKDKFLHKPNAVNIKMFDIPKSREQARKELGLSQEEKIVLYAGHLFDWKGVGTLLEAYKFLPEYSIYFVGGTDSDIKSMKEKSNKMNAENVYFLGRKQHNQIPLYYKSADVLVLPNTAKMDVSKYETSPVKLFEYMASKTPIVASNIPSIKNIVDESMVWFFEPDNPEDLAKVIKTVNPEDQKTQKSFIEVQSHTWGKRVGDIKKFIGV